MQLEASWVCTAKITFIILHCVIVIKVKVCRCKACAEHIGSPYEFHNIKHKEFELFCDNVTNQIFVKVPNKIYNKLNEFVFFELWADKGIEKVIK